MKITCLTVGKKHDKSLESAITDYQKRLKHYVNFAFEYIPNSDKETESQLILKRLKQDDTVILLDETGEQLSNQQLASIFQTQSVKATKNIIIIIGGAYGVSQPVKNRSDYTISLSCLVFPHQIVRLIMIEQLYRTFNMLAGGKYHHQ